MKSPIWLSATAAGFLLLAGCTITLPGQVGTQASAPPQVVEVRREVQTVVREPAASPQVVNNYYDNETETVVREPARVVSYCPPARRHRPVHRTVVCAPPRPRHQDHRCGICGIIGCVIHLIVEPGPPGHGPRPRPHPRPRVEPPRRDPPRGHPQPPSRPPTTPRGRPPDENARRDSEGRPLRQGCGDNG